MDIKTNLTKDYEMREKIALNRVLRAALISILSLNSVLCQDPVPVVVDNEIDAYGNEKEIVLIRAPGGKTKRLRQWNEKS